jgi:hypothetical protein
MLELTEGGIPMAQAEGLRRVASWLAIPFVTLGLGLALASSAGAAAIPDGVQWSFVGTVSVSGPTNGCCQPVFSQGEQVTGTLTIEDLPTPSPAVMFAVGVDITSSSGQHVGGGISYTGPERSYPLEKDGVPGSTPDQLIFNESIVDSGGPITATLGLQPGWTLFPDPSAYFELVDQDGTAWAGVNPRTGDIFPDSPPDISKFESAFFVIGGSAVGPGPDYLQDAASIRVDITRFVPEPASGALALLALVSFAARRISV